MKDCRLGRILNRKIIKMKQWNLTKGNPRSRLIKNNNNRY